MFNDQGYFKVTLKVIAYKGNGYGRSASPIFISNDTITVITIKDLH